MTVQHKNIADANIHVCKGVASAAVGQTIVADGAAGQAFKYASPRAAIYFNNLSTPYTLTYPSVFTKINATTTASGTALEFTEGTNSRITYTGADTLDFRINVEMSVDQSAGANRDIQVQLYKNSVAVSGASTQVTTVSGSKEQISFMFNMSLANNDFIEVFAKNAGASGDVNFYAIFLAAVGFRG